jgi:inorganic pyrophosphatase/exopolyphosphatase
LDSYYFDPSLKESKWTAKDAEVHEYLLNLAPVGKEYWSYLNNAKNDIELNLKIGISNILIKDYKTYYLLNKGEKGIGVSSIVIPLQILESHFEIEGIC